MKSNQSDNTTDDTNYNYDGGFSFKIGKIVGFKGLKGEMKVFPETNSPEILLEIESVRFDNPDNALSEASVKSIRVKDRTVLICLEEFQDRNSAESLRNKIIYADPDQLLDLAEDQWWVDELVGLNVQDSNGKLLGKVSDIYGNEGEFLEIQLLDSEKKHLVPFVKEIVPRVDIEAGLIEITPPDGLLD